jgi:F-type H+-transporting ATPase subunit b
LSSPPGEKVIRVIVSATYFAAEVEHSAGGLSALGLDVKSFLFQLISFVIVLVILRVFVFGKLVATLEGRRQAVEDSLKHAAETEAKMKDAEANIAKLLAQARSEADDVVAASHKEATQMLQAAEEKAVKRAEHIVTEAKAQMDVELGKARDSLKAETAQLVALAAGKILGEKLDASKDEKLIAAALKGAKEQANG